VSTTTPDLPDDRRVWVTTDPTADGVYRTTIQVGRDFALVLTPDEVGSYTRALTEHATRAAYDAALLAQLVPAVGREHALVTVQDLRAERPDIDVRALGRLQVTPGIARRTLRGFLRCEIPGVAEWQWSPCGAMSHVGNVLQVAAAADLDAAYRRYLRGTIGLDEEASRVYVGALRQHHQHCPFDDHGACPGGGDDA
jgi:hypothetical protein